MTYEPRVGDLVRFKRSLYNASLSEKQSMPGPTNMNDMEYWYGPSTDVWVGVVLQAGIKGASWAGESDSDVPAAVKVCWNDSGGETILTSYITEIEPVVDEIIKKHLEKTLDKESRK